MTENSRISLLLERFLSDSATTAEQAELWTLLEAGDAPKEVLEKLWIASAENQTIVSENRWQQMLSRVYADSGAVVAIDRRTRIRRITRWAAAAAVIILIATGSYFAFFNKGDKPVIATVPASDIPAPDVTKARLVLNDGRTLYLDSMSAGTLELENGMRIVKGKDGQISYEGNINGEVVYNTIANPRGSQTVSLSLADGSKVWLNAESSIKYPVAFTGTERKVQITGEAYFEVAKDASKKFIVEASGVSTEVLGTHFNVNSYSDEGSIKVTLLEGSVRVIRSAQDDKAFVLKPGQQAMKNVNGELSLINNVNVEEVMAWKNGRFQFGGAGIEEVMRQISRWYDVEVVYEVKPQEVHFRGGISREVEASKVFKMLETTEAVHFRIEGKKVYVIR